MVSTANTAMFVSRTFNARPTPAQLNTQETETGKRIWLTSFNHMIVMVTPTKN